MLESHVKYNSASGKRQLLIVDDEEVNRLLLSHMVEKEFDPLFAKNGLEALEVIGQNKDTLSVVLLDLMMPEMNGMEVIRRMKQDPALARIPILVLTSEKEAEVDSLRLGAIDFIAKPFHAPEVILARIEKAVELSEDRSIIEATERENLTGLLSRAYFYKYAKQYDKFHAGAQMDALVFDVNHFHLINEIYGRERGDEVLADISRFLKDLVDRTGGMATRLEADTFLFYVKHNDYRYEDLLEALNAHFTALDNINVKVRIGIYQNVDKSIDIERRFDRARKAANMIRDNYSQLISYYDDADYQNDIYYEKLTSEMNASIEKDEFEIYFQPKYDISRVPFRIASAEALIRWNHPVLGVVSPSTFIPLFESNGMIQELDHYVWNKVASYVHSWETELGFSVPVSVNVSRIDLFNSDTPDILEDILEENDLDTNKLFVEITESAYADTLEQLLAMIEKLKEKGFVVEMDDFGSGFSSLNMLSDFPLDILKLDIQFIRDMMKSTKKQEAVRLVLELADSFHMDVVAEGVEEEAQVEKLRELGCRLIQGYYFSKPLPEPEFRQLMLKERAGDAAE